MTTGSTAHQQRIRGVLTPPTLSCTLFPVDETILVGGRMLRTVIIRACRGDLGDLWRPRGISVRRATRDKPTSLGRATTSITI